MAFVRVARGVVEIFLCLKPQNGFPGAIPTKYAIDAISNYHTKYYTMNPRAAAMPASVGLKDSSSSSCVSKLTSVLPGRDLIA